MFLHVNTMLITPNSTHDLTKIVHTVLSHFFIMHCSGEGKSVYLCVLSVYEYKCPWHRCVCQETIHRSLLSCSIMSDQGSGSGHHSWSQYLYPWAILMTCFSEHNYNIPIPYLDSSYLPNLIYHVVPYCSHIEAINGYSLSQY